MSSPSFAELGVSNAVVDALTEQGITAPFPVQRLVLEDLIAGHDVMVKSPTGSGKTLAFGLPMIDRTAAEARRPAALVLAPTRELALQIVEELRPLAHARALGIAAVYGGAGLMKQAKLAPKSHILVATPGRLEDLLDRGALTLRNVRTLVLDEADRMLDMGFRPAVDRIVKQISTDRQTVVLSATLDGEAGRLADAYSRDARRHEHEHAEADQGAIEHRFLKVDHEGKVDALVNALEGERGRTLVFVRTKHGADRLVKRLAQHDLAAVAMHGNKTQGQRERALAQFDSGRVDALVATDVAARGIDVRDITHVINFDAPAAREDYVHRIGRTGRAGATGIGITFVMGEQRRDVAKIAAELDLHEEFAAAGFPSEQQRRGTHPNSSPTSRRAQSGSTTGNDGRRRRSGRPRPRV
jgi:superfamily II DNA/RNA helicase